MSIDETSLVILVLVALLCDFGTAAGAVESAAKPFSLRLLGSTCVWLEASEILRTVNDCRIRHTWLDLVRAQVSE